MTFFGNSRLSRICASLLLLTCLILSGCLGGGEGDGEGDGEGGGGTGGGAGQTINGTAAAGAQIVGLVAAKDSKGLTFVSTTIAPSGAYTINVTGGTAPYILQATGISAATGKAATYYSFSSTANPGGNVNITPLTDMVVAQASGQSPAMLYTNCNVTSCVIPAASQVNAAEAAVNTSLINLFTQFGVPTTGLNLLTSPFVAGAVGAQSAIDAMLDAITVIANPASPTSFDIVANSITGLAANTVLVTLSASAPAVPLTVNPALDASAVAAASSAAAQAILGGNYSGTYSDGAWQIDIATTGDMSGSAIPAAGAAFAITGTIASDGVAVFGNVGNGEIFTGTFTRPGSAAGTWANTFNGKTGTFTGSRVDAVTVFAGHHAGTFAGADSGVWELTATAGGAISGTSTSTVDGSICSFSGIIGNNASIILTSNGVFTGAIGCGATFMGNYSKVSGAINGYWENSGYGKTGTFSGF
jgi:hypothetical protein